MMTVLMKKAGAPMRGVRGTDSGVYLDAPAIIRAQPHMASIPTSSICSPSSFYAETVMTKTCKIRGYYFSARSIFIKLLARGEKAHNSCAQ